MDSESRQLELGIAALEAQRALLGDAVVDAVLGPMRVRLAGLHRSPRHDRKSLRSLSILFLDVVDSTALGQQLDPEELGSLLDDVLTRATALVVSHGGEVLQYAGDNLLAVFGATEAREDDAERAVRCGLALCDLGRDVGADVADRHGRAGAGVRVGLHTGTVMLGSGLAADDSMRGMAVHIAARMEQTALPNTCRISHDTYALVRGVFDVTPQAPLTVKGVDRALKTYLVDRAKPRAFRVPTRGIEGVPTRLVGRDAEFARLTDAFARVVVPGAGFIPLLVVGDAGVGKSRLLHDFRDWAETRAESFVVFQARLVPESRRQPYALVRDLFAWRWEIGDGDTMATAARKLECGVAVLSEDDDPSWLAHAHRIGQLVGLDFGTTAAIRELGGDAALLRDRAFDSAAHVLRRFSEHRSAPLILYLDDLHWADDGSIAFLEHLARANADVPMLVIALLRPKATGGPFAEDTRFGERIDVAPLDDAPSRELALELLQRLPSIPPDLRDLIVDRAQGNPFFMEEIVRMLVDRGAIDTSPAAWSLDADRLVSLAVPPTVQGVLQARLDALPPAERHALQMASVAGMTFWDAALAAIDADALDALPDLVRAELLEDRPIADSDRRLREYTFRHHLLQQAAYATVPRRVRREAHLKVARWLSTRSGLPAQAMLATVAEHYERAGDEAEAAAQYAKAAAFSASVFENDAVLAQVARALKLAPAFSELCWDVLALRERTLDLLGRRAEQKDDIEALGALAEKFTDDERRAEAAWRRSDHAMRTDDWPAQERHAREALALAERCGADEIAMRASQRLATAVSMLGDPHEGCRIAARAFERALATDRLESQGRLANTMMICLERIGDWVEQLRFARLALDISTRFGNARSRSIDFANLGKVLRELGDLDEARRCLEEGLAIGRAIGQRSIEAHQLGALAEVLLAKGDVDAATRASEEGLAIVRGLKSTFRMAESVWVLGDIRLAQQRLQEADANFVEAHTLAVAAGHRPIELNALDGRVNVALENGDLERAVALMAVLLARVELDIDALAADGVLRLEAPRLTGIETFRIAFTLFRLWEARHDPRATAAIAAAYETIERIASRISDPAMRQSYRENGPMNHVIRTAWSARNASRRA